MESRGQRRRTRSALPRSPRRGSRRAEPTGLDPVLLHLEVQGLVVGSKEPRRRALVPPRGLKGQANRLSLRLGSGLVAELLTMVRVIQGQPNYVACSAHSTVHRGRTTARTCNTKMGPISRQRARSANVARFISSSSSAHSVTGSGASPTRPVGPPARSPASTRIPIDQRVVVIGDDDQRASRRHVLEPDDLHAAVEGRDQQARDGREEAESVRRSAPSRASRSASILSSRCAGRAY